MLLPTKLLMKAGVDPLIAVRLVLASFSALWTALLFQLLRVIGCRQLDAGVFTLLGLSSAAAIFFFAAPETFLVGSLTIMLAILWASLDERGERSPIGEAFVSAATLSITVTNWMVGLFSTFYRRRSREAIQISAQGLAIVVLIWTIQKYVFRSSEFFLGAAYLEMEREHLFSPEARGLGQVVFGFFAHAMVMPEIQLVDRPSSGRWMLLLTQASAPASSGPWGIVALILWVMLFIGGVVALSRLKQKPRLRLLLGTVLLGQLALHLVFGNETFLYSPHWVPMLVVIAALATLMERWRRAVLIVAGLFCICAGANNLMQFSRAIHFLTTYQPIVQKIEKAENRQLRTDDPWPEAANGISTPWDRDDYDLAAYEPGGSLWPAMGTFHMGLWVTDPSGKILVTSHDLDKDDLKFHRISKPGHGPRLQVTTSYYELEWQSQQHRRWRLNLEVFRHETEQLFLVLRGVGWRFSRIRSIIREDKSLLINGRWRIIITPAVEKMGIGEEGQSGWTVPDGKITKVNSELGWGFARIGPLTPGVYEVIVFDERSEESVDTIWGTINYSSQFRGLRDPRSR